MKKLLSILFVFILIIGCNSKSNIDRVLAEVVKEINKSCPMFVDEQTRLDYTEVDENGFFHYIYTFPTISKSDIDISSFYIKQRDMLNEQYHTSSDLSNFRENKVILKYTYFDMYKNQIISIVIPK
jgi:hypothetical protein